MSKKSFPLVIDDSNLSVVDYPIYESNPSDNLDKLEIITKRIYEEFLDQNKYKTLNLLCTGSSGAFVAGVIMTMLRCQYDSEKLDVVATHISKEGESKHGECTYVFHNKTFNVIVDDFICSGESVLRIFNALENVPIHGISVTGAIGSEYDMKKGLERTKEFWEKTRDLKFIICRKLINEQWTS